MSRRQRPLGEYLRAARKLAETKPQFQKYITRVDLSANEKAGIARVAKLAPLKKRSTFEYLEIAKRLSKLAPGLKKYTRRKELNNGEKSAISHKEKILRYSDHLIPVSTKQAKKLKGLLFAPGVQAIQLRNTSPDAKIKKVGKDIVLTSNGRNFIYWRLENVKPRGMKKAADTVFNKFEATFQIEHIAALAQKAFKKFKPKQIFLWAESGRVGEGFADFDVFMDWIYESYSQYKNVERWVNGVAIQLDMTENEI